MKKYSDLITELARDDYDLNVESSRVWKAAWSSNKYRVSIPETEKNQLLGALEVEDADFVQMNPSDLDEIMAPKKSLLGDLLRKTGVEKLTIFLGPFIGNRKSHGGLAHPPLARIGINSNSARKFQFFAHEYSHIINFLRSGKKPTYKNSVRQMNAGNIEGYIIDKEELSSLFHEIALVARLYKPEVLLHTYRHIYNNAPLDSRNLFPVILEFLKDKNNLIEYRLRVVFRHPEAKKRLMKRVYRYIDEIIIPGLKRLEETEKAPERK